MIIMAGKGAVKILPSYSTSLDRGLSRGPTWAGGEGRMGARRQQDWGKGAGGRGQEKGPNGDLDTVYIAWKEPSACARAKAALPSTRICTRTLVSQACTHLVSSSTLPAPTWTPHPGSTPVAPGGCRCPGRKLCRAGQQHPSGPRHAPAGCSEPGEGGAGSSAPGRMRGAGDGARLIWNNGKGE